MSIRTAKVALRGIFVALVGLSFANPVEIGAFQIEDASPTRMATFDSAGETSFALSVGPESQDRQRASDVIVFVDTSASQTGAYKRDSLEMLRGFVRNLSGDDRIRIFAVDLEAIPLYRGFVAPNADQVSVAIENLSNRVALGSTDMQNMFETAIEGFGEDKTRNRNVVYIGDGISRAGILHTEAFTNTVKVLVEKQISISSFAIGPERNIALLASLANHTGGNFVIDTDAEDSANNGAMTLAESVHGSVFWPQSAKLPESLVEIYPGKCPPMRTDRDTILVGSISSREALDIELTGIMNGQEVTKSWSINPETASEEFSFLPKMLKEARKDGGVSLPTVGSAGLSEYARVIDEKAIDLKLLGDNQKPAGTAAIAAAAPAESRTAMAARFRLQDGDDPFGSVEETPSEDTTAMEVAPNQEQGNAVGETVDVVPVPDSVTSPLEMGSAKESEVSKLLMQAADADIRDQILSVEDRDRIINEKLRKQVQFETERALQEQKTDPAAAIERLKNMLEVVDQTPELTDGTVTELRSRLESSLLSATRKKLEFDEAVQLQSRNSAIVNARRNEILNYELAEEKKARLIGQYTSLMKEGNFQVAEEVADSVYEAFPNSPEAVLATERARIARTHFELLKIRREKERLFTDAVREIYKSTYPISGNPPLVFPDAEEWIEKRALRAKYKNVRLAGTDNDRRILDALDKPYDLIFDGDPFGDVMEQLRKDFKINIVIDVNLDGILDEDTEVSANLAGVSLGKALRTMLKEVDATYVVKDEVLQIISIDDEGEPGYLVTDVYNVGDLVAPRTNPGGGIGGGGFGGGLGGQGGGGFGGGGLGGQGGGFGGGGGGLGGAFCIQDAAVGFSLGDATDKPLVEQGTVSLKSNKVIEVAPSTDPNAAWDAYFKSTQPEMSSVRATVRQMLKENRHEEIIALLNGAIRNNQGDSSWMFQALGLSMQIVGRPNIEIERALMSAVDLSDDFQDAMIAAVYMSRNDMIDRSLQVLEDIAKSKPAFADPYRIGLAVAERNNHIEGMKWSSIGVLSQEWPDQPDLVKKARFAAAAVKSALSKAGKTDELEAFEISLTQAKHRDCHISVKWTGDADIDVFVEEPGATICSRLAPRTTSGGVHYGDAYSGNKSASGQMQETYVLPKGFSGDYRLIIRRMTGEVTSGKVNVAISTHFNSDFEASEERQVALDDNGAIVLFKLNNGRRTDDLEQHTLETLVRKKMASQKAALAQRMSQLVSPAAFQNFYGSNLQLGGGGGDDDFFGNQFAGGGGNNNRFSPFAPSSVVGYQPQITQIPTGTFMNVNHATTADRLYVLISTSPNFSTITEVQTFNILGDANNALGGQGGGGAGGGLGGQGGGGGFGGGFGGQGGGAF